MRRARLALQAVVTLIAAAAALVPLPAALVERYYAGWFYPALQSRLTSWSNESAVSLFDVLVATVAAGLAIAWLRWLARAWRLRSVWPVVQGVTATVVLAAAIYLWFALAWGFNYSRPPLEETIGYDRSRVTAAALDALADRATDEVNRAHAPGHSAGFPERDAIPPALVTSFHRLEARLGRSTPTTPSRPKRTVFGLFFRASGVSGMHAPFLLETLLNPDLTPPERPAVLAHEWAHLSGYAPEDDASFVGLLAALGADPASRYSAWLEVFNEASSQLAPNRRRDLATRLGPGPRADREAIARRLEALNETVSRVSWDAYDQYLKSQGVAEGVQSYSRVVQLLLGTGALNESSNMTPAPMAYTNPSGRD